MLSVCISHRGRASVRYNGRTRPLFRGGFASLCAAVAAAGLGPPRGVQAEVLIADWPTGEPELDLGPWVDELACASGLPVRVLAGQGPYSVGAGRNQAAKAAVGDVLFFMDADMIVVPEVIRRGMETALQGKGYFPLYARLDPSGKAAQDGVGTGNCIVLRAHHVASGGFPEWSHWGGEDTRFAHWFQQRGLMVRETIAGFVHQFHPRSDCYHE